VHRVALPPAWLPADALWLLQQLGGFSELWLKVCRLCLCVTQWCMAHLGEDAGMLIMMRALSSVVLCRWPVGFLRLAPLQDSVQAELSAGCRSGTTCRSLVGFYWRQAHCSHIDAAVTSIKAKGEPSNRRIPTLNFGWIRTQLAVLTAFQIRSAVQSAGSSILKQISAQRTPRRVPPCPTHHPSPKFN